MYAGLVRPMVEYDRKIRYLDYLENGQRCQGAGFIKLERRDGLCNISLQISGVYRRDRFTRPFLLLTEKGERELCKLQFADGGIKTCFEGLDSHGLGGQDVSYDQVYGVRIPISDGKEIRCVWRHIETEAGAEQQPGMQAEAGSSSEQKARMQAESGSGTERQAGMQGEAGAEQQPGMLAEAGAEQQLGMQAEPGMEQQAGMRSEAGAQRQPEMRSEPGAGQQPESGSPQAEAASASKGNGARGREAKFAFKEDKWEQLWMIYPHVHPFGDQREYLSIGPSDFVLLAMKSYRLVNNSFLLHGYYNYQHLILMKGGRQGQPKFYIGVPGNLYEREKRTALMFGFEGFECNREPAEEGDFGYFLIPVEL